VSHPVLAYTINASGLSWPGEPGQRDTAPPRREVAACREFLARCDATRTGRYGSYALKHVIERAAGRSVTIARSDCHGETRILRP
jgi:hypothetical protein